MHFFQYDKHPEVLFIKILLCIFVDQSDSVWNAIAMMFAIHKKKGGTLRGEEEDKTSFSFLLYRNVEVVNRKWDVILIGSFLIRFSKYFLDSMKVIIIKRTHA